MIKIERHLKTRIIKTRWEYGLNPQSFYINVFDDGSKTYIWNTARYQRNFIDTNEYWFKFYWNFVRTPWIRKGEYADPSDTCELRIEKYNIKTGEMIKSFDSKKY